MALEQALSTATILVLAAAFPLSLVAARGFRGAPFGGVLRPIPVAIVAFIALNAAWGMNVSVPPAYQLVTSTAAILAVLVAAARVFILLTGRRKL